MLLLLLEDVLEEYDILFERSWWGVISWIEVELTLGLEQLVEYTHLVE